MSHDEHGAIAARTLPHSLEAERAVLGAVLLHHESFSEAAEIVRAADFFRQAHRTIFEHMCRLEVRGEPIEFVTLCDALVQDGALEDAGGQAYIAALVDGMPHATNVAA